jgi:endonuclease YncB( thermonuclease family)
LTRGETKDRGPEGPKAFRFAAGAFAVEPGEGKTLDVGLAHISVGLAWWFRRYADEQSAEDRGRYQSEEEEARLRKRGLWVDQAPVPPWEWRSEGRAGR